MAPERKTKHWLETQIHLGQRESRLRRFKKRHKSGTAGGQEEGREAEGRVGRQEVEEEAVTRDRIQVHCHKGGKPSQRNNGGRSEESAGTSGRR